MRIISSVTASGTQLNWSGDLATSEIPSVGTKVAIRNFIIAKVSGSTSTSITTSTDLSLVSAGQTLDFGNGVRRSIDSKTGTGPYTLAWTGSVLSPPVADSTVTVLFSGMNYESLTAAISDSTTTSITTTTNVAIGKTLDFGNNVWRVVTSNSGGSPNILGWAKALDAAPTGSATVHNGWTMSLDGSDYQMIDSSRLDSGHVLNWTFNWDSSQIATTAKLGVPIYFRVTDANGQASAEIPITVDVVPYITSVKRNLAYNTHRSRSGAYSLLRGESTEVVNGFNLASGGAGTNSLNLTSNKAGTTVTTTLSGVAYDVSKERMTFTVPTDAKDGYLSLFVNGALAVNNINKNTLAWNKENSASAIGSTYWYDDRYIHIWQSDAAADQFGNISNPIFPAMSMDGDGDLYASFSNYSSAMVYYSTLGNAVTPTPVFYTYDPPEETEIVVSGTGTPQVNVLYSANYQGGNTTDWVSWSDQAGGLYMYDDNAPSAYVGRDRRNVYRFELFYHDQMLQQFKNLRIARTGSAGGDRIHIAYYDRITNAIKYSNTTDGATYTLERSDSWVNNCTTAEYSWVKIDGGVDANDTAAYTDGSSIALPTARFNGDLPLVNSTRVSAGTGETVALVLTKTSKFPVVIYFDAQSSQIRLARANSENPKGSATAWTVQKVLAATDSNNGVIVDYLTAKIDSAGQLHIAFENSKGELVYVKSTNTTPPSDGSADWTFGSSQVIDSSGMWADITVNGTTPYISYLSKVNSFDGMNIAYIDSSLDLNGDGAAEGGWETMTAAMNYKATGVRTSVEAHPTPSTGGWTAAIGFTPGNYYRAVKLIGK